MMEDPRNLPLQRSLSATGNHRRGSNEPPTFSFCSPQPSRRYSNPASSSFSSPFRTRSPSDPQHYNTGYEPSSRRFSQPASPSGYGIVGTSLIKHERESYSSLNYLPEVRTYLQFMEDTPLPLRSHSFSGRNSSRRSSYNRRRRARSRPRTPTPQPLQVPMNAQSSNCIGDEKDCVFNQAVTTGTCPSSFYGRYLTPQRSGSFKEKQPSKHSLSVSMSNSPNRTNSYYDHDDTYDNDADAESSPPILRSSSPIDDSPTGAGFPGNERIPADQPNFYNSQRRYSNIRTTFI